MPEYRSWRAVWARVWVGLVHLTAGGGWSDQLPKNDQRNLRWFFFDGLFAAASDAITVTYLTLFVLSLGATAAQIGTMTALASLSATLLLLPGAILTDRYRNRKAIVLWGGGGISRLTLLIMAAIPLGFQGQPAVYVAILLKVIADGFANLSLPPWVSLTADIVPMRWRGRYFGTRNFVMGAIGMAVTFLAGQMITRMGAPQGYQVALLIAFAIGMASSFSYSRIKEPAYAPNVASAPSYSPRALLRTLTGDSNFLMLCIYTVVWNMSLSFAVPFFNVFLVRDLNATAAMVGILSIVSSLAALPGQRLFGPLSDRWGPYRVQLVTGFLIPLAPLAWAFIRAPWQAIPINIFAGFLWAGFNLASFNLLLAISPQEQRALYSAIFQISVMVSSAAGAAIGGQVADQWGIPAAFIVSAAGRLVSAIIFARIVRAPAQAPAAAQPVDDHPD